MREYLHVQDILSPHSFPQNRMWGKENIEMIAAMKMIKVNTFSLILSDLITLKSSSYGNVLYNKWTVKFFCMFCIRRMLTWYDLIPFWIAFVCRDVFVRCHNFRQIIKRPLFRYGFWYIWKCYVYIEMHTFSIRWRPTFVFFNVLHSLQLKKFRFDSIMCRFLICAHQLKAIIIKWMPNRTEQNIAFCRREYLHGKISWAIPWNHFFSPWFSCLCWFIQFKTNEVNLIGFSLQDGSRRTIFFSLSLFSR